MRYFILLILIGFLQFSAQAQRIPNEEDMKRIETMKIGYLTKNLDLTPEQAQKFWPIYNEYQKEEREIRKQIRALMLSKPHEKSDAEMIKALEKSMALKQKNLDLEKKYLSKFLDVLSPKQVGGLYRAEREFRHQMFRELRKRGKGKHHHGGGFDDN